MTWPKSPHLSIQVSGSRHLWCMYSVSNGSSFNFCPGWCPTIFELKLPKCKLPGSYTNTKQFGSPCLVTESTARRKHALHCPVEKGIPWSGGGANSTPKRQNPTGISSSKRPWLQVIGSIACDCPSHVGISQSM